MFHNVASFYEAAQDSVRVFNEFITQHNLADRTAADHLCYKTGSRESFETIRGMFEQENAWFYQAPIAGRRIATIRTKQTLDTLAGTINLVELSDQKPDGSQKEGFDHIELYPTTMTYNSLVTELQEAGLRVDEIVRPHHTTHDIHLPNGFIVRLTRERLAEKITKEMTN